MKTQDSLTKTLLFFLVVGVWGLLLHPMFVSPSVMAQTRPGTGHKAAIPDRVAVSHKADGIWRMVSRRQSAVPGVTDIPKEQQTTLKFITQNHYIGYIYDPSTKEIMGTLSGTCLLIGDAYQETAQYGSGDNYATLLGQPQHFTVKIEGNHMHLWGVLKRGGDDPSTVPLEEVWERVGSESVLPPVSNRSRPN